MSNHYCILKACLKKIKKLLKIQGVDSLNIDEEKGKVGVVGNENPNELINTLKKSSKHAQKCVTHKPVAEPSKKNSKSSNKSNTRNDNVIPSHHPHTKGNNGNRNKGFSRDPMMNNAGGHHHRMMQMPPSYGRQQRFMTMPMMNQQNAHMNMFPPMHGMPHPSMMHGMPHPSMMHGMQHPSMMHGMPHPSMMHGMPHPSMMHGMQHPSMMHGIQHPSMMHGMPYPP